MPERAELGNVNAAPRGCSERSFGKPGENLAKPAAVHMLAAFTFSLALAYSASLFAQAKPTTEYEIKAAFLYNFAKFVEWPVSAFSSPKQPLNVCVLGRDPFGKALEDALLGKSIGEHPVSLERSRDFADLAGCQIVFVSATESPRLPEILVHLRGHSALLVGESEGFAGAGGTIEFVLEQNRVRFAINPNAADRGGLKISSKLLALALIVHDEAEAKK